RRAGLAGVGGRRRGPRPPRGRRRRRLHTPRSPPRPRAPDPMPSAAPRVGPTPPRRAARQTLPLSAVRTPRRPPSPHRFLQKPVPCPVLVHAGFAARATVRVHPLKQETGHQAAPGPGDPGGGGPPLPRPFTHQTGRGGAAPGPPPPPRRQPPPRLALGVFVNNSSYRRQTSSAGSGPRT